MKVSPVAAGAPKTVNPNEGTATNPERMARAKAVAAGQAPAAAPPVDRQVEQVQNSLKKIKMKTQVSQNRHERVEEPVVEAPEPVTSDIPDTTEQAAAVSEETKPLSPQFAALAKQKRALQLKEQEILAREQALNTQSTGMKSLEEYRARIKANALSVLQEEGVTYDQLTEQILASNQGDGVAYSKLESDIKAIKEGLENQTKTLAQRDADTEKQVLSQIGKESDELIASGDDFEMVREAGYGPKVVELIHKTFKQTGELLDVTEAATLIENELLEDSLKWARLKKVQSRLAPVQEKQPQPVQQDRPNTKVMRTLTNRDGSSSASMSKRERAIAAMEGRLK